MIKEKVLIVGASGHAKVCIDIFEKEDKYEIVGLIDLPGKVGTKFFNYEVLGSEENIPTLFEKFGECKIFVAVGDAWLRHKISEKIKGIISNIDFISAIHPSAIIARGVKIGRGVAIMAGVVINSDCQIGDFAILNTNSSLDHDCILNEYGSMLPNSVTGGGVHVGAFSVISIGATVLHGVKIGDHSIIGAGAVLTKNCPDKTIMYGVPAKKIRTRIIGEKYL